MSSGKIQPGNSGLCGLDDKPGDSELMADADVGPEVGRSRKRGDAGQMRDRRSGDEMIVLKYVTQLSLLAIA